MCFSKEEGGTGFSSLYTMAKALCAKLWWNFRISTSSLWVKFMWNKYYKKIHHLNAKGHRSSHVWRRLVDIREEIGHNIWWRLKSCNFSF